MASSKTRAPEEEALLDADVEGIPEERKTTCIEDLWDYYEPHKGEAENLEEWAKKRGLRP